jgi:hypothetical protein
MRLRNRGLKQSWLFGALLLVLVTITGCVEVEVRDAIPAAGAPEPFASPLLGEDEEHNLAILAVDFDPPLDYQQLIIRRRSIALLVAVENRGTSTERDVAVRAQLSTSEDPDLLLSQGASISSIAPGEIQVVRFAQFGRIPYHQIYRLEVAVDPIKGESDLGDNRKAFDIEIRQDEPDP